MMKKRFKRNDLLLSLCGLNCSLCPMLLDERCSGCREGSMCYMSCQIAPCSMEHGNIDYCFECGEYPCEKYDGIELYDSLITHRNQKKDLEKAKTIGIENYHIEQLEKKEILNQILKRYDIGKRYIFFCLAVNLLEVDDLKQILKDCDESTKEMDLKQRSDYLKHELDELGKKRNIILKLNTGRY